MLLGLRYQRCAAWLGLFAICLQVAVVFPHVCPDDIAGLIPHPGHDPEISSATPDAQDLPLCPLSEGRGGDACIVYAAAHLAGSALLPDAIRLDRAPASERSIIGWEVPLHLSRPQHLLFQTRAPPTL